MHIIVCGFETIFRKRLASADRGTCTTRRPYVQGAGTYCFDARKPTQAEKLERRVEKAQLGRAGQ